MSADGFKCNLKGYQQPNYLEDVQNRIESDQTLENFFKDHQGQYEEFKNYLKRKIFNDLDEFQQHLDNIQNQWDSQFKVELKRIEVFRLIMAMYLGLLERNLSKGGFYIVNMNTIKNSNNYISKQKLMCFKNYIKAFYLNSDKIQEEKIVFTKNSVSKEDFRKKFEQSTYQKIDFEFTQSKNEDHLNSTVVDFADENIGGLVLDARNCAQEEIVMLIFAEATVCMVFIPPMKETEAVLIENLKKYSNYTGYEQSFQCSPSLDLKGSYNMLAIDAKPFYTENQFTEENIYRELIKSYAGFEISLKNAPNSYISTGRWGCGIFRGNPYLKALIQFVSFAIAVNQLNLKDKKIIMNCVNDQSFFNFGMKLNKLLQEKEMQLNLINLKKSLLYMQNEVSDTKFQYQGNNIISQIYQILIQNIQQAVEIQQENDDLNQPSEAQDIRSENDNLIQPLVGQDINQEKLINTQNIEGNKESQFKSNAQIIEEKQEMQIQNEAQIDQEKKESENLSIESNKNKNWVGIATILLACGCGCFVGIIVYKKVFK
ncbi:unnamed protein product (macronuclear) [Paramecium tetraurelia]|uniref:PARG catalytic Macro domain-containing protein n=1 Tax=Paramecium tetraurelia TaxID=5888 RepID=A0BZ73_PARTE|nr:uncharacterized protein GSPATT00033693001 [Paramecium tetraurelia]CAK63840.1 unnamed protein product [Paramecium tetraurelia]|eukprot:XP_001431238.1 hypothetical protein (macronuclear) [Paramecium tetraurelia strain d4-2]